MSQFAQHQADAASMLGEFHEATRNFNEEMMDLVRGRTQAGRNQGHAMVKHIMHSKWDPSEIIEESTHPASDSHSKLRNQKYEQTILNSLLFETINHREEAIPAAHMKTCDWIFQEPYRLVNQEQSWHSFPKWLRGPSKDIYWITGKPGAGKSTLVKYVLADQRFNSALLEWSEQRPLVVAGYFSWNAGTGLQKSHAGLLRTLLHQCLQLRRDLVPRVFPRRWAALSIFDGDVELPEWEYAETLAAFKSLVFEHGKPCSFVFVIDGLDEFEEDHQQLIELLQLINREDYIKICASSRPLNSFRDAFSQSPKLQLEHLTKKDIDFYVRDRFNKSQGFRELNVLHSDAAGKLLAEIVEKSKGVFLWVSVVVRLLLENLGNGDKLADLRKTLADLPDDLRYLYDHIWASIDLKYHCEASRYLQMINSAEELEMTVYSLCFYFADDDVPIDMDISKVSDSFLANALLTVQRRLGSRTRGLLELHKTKEKYRGSVDYSARVDYLHRTAKEWVMSRRDQLRATDPEFDPFLSLLKGEANRMAADDYLMLDYDKMSTFWIQVRLLLRCALRVEDIPRNQDSIVQILEKIDRQNSALSKTKDGYGAYWMFPADFLPDGFYRLGPDSLPHWCNSPAISSRSRFDPRLDIDFLCSMAQLPLPAYVRAKAHENPDIVSIDVLRHVAFGHIPLKEMTVLGKFEITAGFQPQNEAVRLELVEILISHDHDGKLSRRLVEDCGSFAGKHKAYIEKLTARLNISSSADDKVVTSAAQIVTTPPSRLRRVMRKLMFQGYT